MARETDGPGRVPGEIVRPVSGIGVKVYREFQGLGLGTSSAPVRFF